jgi:hypothetical protein
MADNILGKGQGTTNPAPNSKVDVPVDVPVKVKFRFFPANVTAALEGTTPHQAKSLSGLPFVVGTVQGKTFTPLQKSLLRLQASANTVGKLDGGTFHPMTADDIAAWHKALKDAKKKDAPPPAYAHHDTPEYSVKPGATVAICIAVDAKEKWRQHPLWQVTAKGNDIVVDVFETFGKIGLQEAAGKLVTCTEEKSGKPHQVDHYPARLSGDAWMRSTPKYTAADVDAIPADRATDAMKQALKRIYAGDFDAVGKDFAITVLRKSDDKDTASVRLLWRAGENGNCVDNIATLNLKQDVPSRIHPEAYAAAAKAAHDAGIDDVQFSSSWRPMLGSMPHRLSMGLDLVYMKSGADGARLNRAGLLPNQKGHHGDNDNLSEDELKAYDEWQAKKAEAEKAAAESKRADAALATAIKAKSSIKAPAPETAEKLNKAIEEATKNKTAASEAAKDANEQASIAKNRWSKQVGEHEPGPVGRYRRYVMNAKFVSQVLDPWYLVGLAGHKTGELVPNEQTGEGGLALQHNNHMHLSIKDPELQA